MILPIWSENPTGGSRSPVGTLNPRELSPPCMAGDKKCGVCPGGDGHHEDTAWVRCHHGLGHHSGMDTTVGWTPRWDGHHLNVTMA